MEGLITPDEIRHFGEKGPEAGETLQYYIVYNTPDTMVNGLATDVCPLACQFNFKTPDIRDVQAEINAVMTGVIATLKSMKYEWYGMKAVLVTPEALGVKRNRRGDLIPVMPEDDSE